MTALNKTAKVRSLFDKKIEVQKASAEDPGEIHPKDELYTVEELVKWLKCSDKTILRQLAKHGIKPICFGDSQIRRYSLSDVQKLVVRG